MGELSHFDPSGASRMVDVGDKQVSRRTARASDGGKMKTPSLAFYVACALLLRPPAAHAGSDDAIPVQGAHHSALH